jgi:hypothetical protein
VRCVSARIGGTRLTNAETIRVEPGHDDDGEDGGYRACLDDHRHQPLEEARRFGERGAQSGR